MKKTILILLILTLFLAGCTPREKEVTLPTVTKDSPKEEIIAHNKELDESLIQLIQFQPASETQVQATIKTTAGNIKIVLYPEEAPVAVDAFINNADSGVYKNTSFNKIMENFYIEASANNASTQTFDEQSLVRVENSVNLWHFRGALAMRENLFDSPSTDLSNFFIVQSLLLPDEVFKEMETIGYPSKVISKYKEVGGIPGYDNHFTVFGQVVDGLDVVDLITNVRVSSDYVAEKPVMIEDIIIDTSNGHNHSKDANK